MLPETILQSDVLDILFENRNKSYGAYTLRKHYNKRLTQALASIFLLVVLFALLLQFNKGGYNKNKIIPDLNDPIQLMQVTIPADEPKPNIVRPKLRVDPMPQVKFISNIQIVKIPVIDSIPSLKTLENNAIGTANIKEGNEGKDVIPAPSAAGNGKQEEIKQPPLEESAAPVEIAEKMPQFPGGMDAFQKFMQRNLKQPDDLDAGEKIVVLVRFIVEKDGSIVGVKILNSGRKDLDEDVLKIVHKMPKWIPGVQNGRNVSVYFKLPVTFVSIEQ